MGTALAGTAMADKALGPDMWQPVSWRTDDGLGPCSKWPDMATGPVLRDLADRENDVIRASLPQRYLPAEAIRLAIHFIKYTEVTPDTVYKMYGVTQQQSCV